MVTLVSAGGAVLLGALGWFALHFVGRPVREFFDLRREIHHQLMFLANLRIPSAKLGMFDAEYLDPRKKEEVERRFNEATETFRRLGTQIIAFNKTEYFAVRLVRSLRFNPVLAGNGLVALSNSLGDKRESEHHRSTVRRALRL